MHNAAKPVCSYDLPMSDFMQSTAEVYLEKTGMALKKADMPFAPELPRDQSEKLMSTPGEYAKHSPSSLMKRLYGARAVWPDLCVPIQQLVSKGTRWSLECDRRCYRLYQYIYGSCDESLLGQLSFAPGISYLARCRPERQSIDV